MQAAAKVKEQHEVGPERGPFLGYGRHKDEKGDHFYTRKQTRLLNSKEVEQRGLLSKEQERSKNTRNERPKSDITFDGILHENKLNR